MRRVGPRVVAAAAALVVGVAAACSSSSDDDGGATRSASGADHEQTDTATSTTAAGASNGDHASGPSDGCEARPAVRPGTTDEHLGSGGVERSYQLIVPDGYDGTTPLPIVLGLHPLTIDYHVIPAMSGFADMASAGDDFIAAAPSGREGPEGLPYWNAAPAADNDDVEFVADLLDHLEATLCVDTAEVFSIGMSNGAQMSSLLACRLPDRITAIAPIAGVEYNAPCDGAPVPVIAFHGREDPIVPYDGGGLSSVAIADQNLYQGDLPAGMATPTGVDESMRRWAEHNGCDPGPTEDRISPEVHRRTWSGCAAPTVLYIVDNGGHAWPGKPQPTFEAQFGHGTTDIDATELAFAFFFDR